jgi:hypothetical protein
VVTANAGRLTARVRAALRTRHLHGTHPTEGSREIVSLSHNRDRHAGRLQPQQCGFRPAFGSGEALGRDMNERNGASRERPFQQPVDERRFDVGRDDDELE